MTTSSLPFDYSGGSGTDFLGGLSRGDSSALNHQTGGVGVSDDFFDPFSTENDPKGNSEKDLNAAAALSLLQGSSSSPGGDYSMTGSKKKKSRKNKDKRSGKKDKDREKEKEKEGSSGSKRPKKQPAAQTSEGTTPERTKKRQKRDTANYSRILEEIQNRDEVKVYEDEYSKPKLINGHRVISFKPTSRRQCGLLVCCDCGACIVYIRVMDTIEKTLDTILYDADGETTSHHQVVNSYFTGQCRSEKQDTIPSTLSELQNAVGKAISLYTGRITTNISQTLSQHVGERVNGKNTGLPLEQVQKSDGGPKRAAKGGKKKKETPAGTSAFGDVTADITDDVFG